MNQKIVRQLYRFCTTAKTICLPVTIKSDIDYLHSLVNELLVIDNINQTCEQNHKRIVINEQIEKNMMQLIIKISDQQLPNYLVMIFGDLMVSCIDNGMFADINIDEFSAIFDKMNIMPNPLPVNPENLHETFDKMNL